MKHFLFSFLTLSISLNLNLALAATLPSNVQKIQTAPGCEDFAFDSNSGNPRLILSCDDRRGARKQAGFFAFDLLTRSMKEFELHGAKIESLHPHGISLLESASPQRLYVINHQQKSQNQIHKSFTEVLIFEVGVQSLTLVESIRSADRKLFMSPNDLVVLPTREIFMTNPMSLSKSVLYYSPLQKKWSVAAKGFLYPNGIHFKDSKIYLNSSFSGKQYSFDSFDGGRLKGRKLLGDSLGAIDNFTESINGDLLFSGARTVWQFLRYLSGKIDYADSRAYRWHDSVLEVLVTPSLDGLISAPSVAFQHRDQIILGQPFGDFILLIDQPVWQPYKN